MNPRPWSETLVHIRKRPVLYLGEQNIQGRTRLPELLLKMAAVAAREGRGDEVDLRLEPAGSCTFTFNGTLWPADFVTEPLSDSLTRRLTLADVEQGKSSQERNPHFVSVFAVYDHLALINALSSWMEITHRAEGCAWRQRFQDGVPEGSPQVLPAGEASALSPRGTCIRFLPTRVVFPHARFSRRALSDRMLDLAALTAPARYRLYDEPARKEYRYGFEGGLSDYATWLAASEAPLHAPWCLRGHHGTTRVQLALQWSRQRRHVLSGWSNLKDVHRGPYLKGLHEGLLQVFQQVQPHRVSEPPTHGLTAVLTFIHPAPHWEGSAWEQLANPECRDAVRELLLKELIPRLEAEPEVVERILSQQTDIHVPEGRPPFRPNYQHLQHSWTRARARRRRDPSS